MNQLNFFKNFQKNGAGFTFIEILLVMGILTLLIGAAIATFHGRKEHIAFQEVKTSIILALEKARSRAETGFGTSNHGVRINGSDLTIFEDCFPPCGNDINITLPSFINVTPANVSVIFDRLTAQTGTNTDIIISNSGGETIAISIKEDGTIISN